MPKTSPSGDAHGRWNYTPIVLVALLGALVTMLVFLKVADLERQRRHDAFSEAARDRLLVVQREVAHALGVVQDIASFFEASRHVTRRQFREFVGPALRRDLGILALQWVPRIRGDERAGFVAKARRSFPPFEVREIDPAGAFVAAVARPVHYPVLYVQPYKANKNLLGLDLAADPDVLASLEQAAASRAVRVSVPAPLSEAGGILFGFGVHLPVYHTEDGSEQDMEADVVAVEASRTDLRGFVIGLFQAGTLVEHALRNLGPAGVDMWFFAPENGSAAQPFYVHSSRTRDASLDGTGDAALNALSGYRGEVEAGNRTWIVICNPVPGYFEPEHWGSRLILGGGVAFTLLLCVYLFAMIGRAQEVRRLVAQRTVELERSNAALNTEIGERRRAEGALRELNATLEHRVARRTAEAEGRARDLEQFAYVASHDLKAPLRGIANLAGWLKEDLLDRLTPETEEQIDLLRDRVARMNDLVEGLLAYSRIGKAESSVEQVDSAELVAEAVDSLALPTSFRVEVAPDMPRLVTDRLHLGQVFANLIGNAINHHDRDHGQVQVSGQGLGKHCEFHVIDDGPGIAPEYHDKVFKMFQTLSVKDFGGDTGIGLALVKKLVEEHGGSIRLSSGPGRGARFDFSWQDQGPDTDRKRDPNSGGRPDD